SAFVETGQLCQFLLVKLFDIYIYFFFSSRRRHTRLVSDWSSDVCSSDLNTSGMPPTVTPVIPVAVRLKAAELTRVTEPLTSPVRSEERRVGKEGRSRGAPDD